MLRSVGRESRKSVESVPKDGLLGYCPKDDFDVF